MGRAKARGGCWGRRSMEKKIESNVLVLREDIINTWKWTEEIKKDLESMKKRQDRIENYLKNLSSLLSSA